MNKRVLMMILLVVLTLVLAACGGDDSDQATEYPVVRLAIGDQIIEQDIYSYCWPVTADNWECDLNEASQENPALASVTVGDEVKFIVDDGRGTIRSFTATLLDGQGGIQDLGAGPEGAYAVELDEGKYRVQVNVEFADVEGATIDSQDTPYVSYVFGLDVSGAMVALESTATPAEQPAETPVLEEPGAAELTEEPSGEAPAAPTEEVMEQAPEEPTAEAPVPTEEVLEQPTDEPVAEELVPTEEVLEQATQEPAAEVLAVPTEEALEQPTEEPVAEVLVPTEEVLEQATQEPTAEVLAVPTEEALEQPTEEPVAEELVPTEEVLEQATEEPAAIEGAELPTQEATEEPALPLGDLGEIAIVGTVSTRSDGIAIPLVGAQVSYTLNSTAQPENSGFDTTVTNNKGLYSFPPIPILDTDQIMVTVDLPGYEPQTIQRTGIETANSGGIFDVEIVPQPGSVIPPTEAPPAESTDAMEEGPTLNEIPALTIVYGGRVYRPVGYQLCERAASGERLCVEQPVSGATQDRLRLLRGTDAQLMSSGERPTDVRIEYLTDSGIPTGQPEDRPGDNTTLFIIAPEPGDYIMSVALTWADRDASYFFRVTVSN